MIHLLKVRLLVSEEDARWHGALASDHGKGANANFATTI